MLTAGTCVAAPRLGLYFDLQKQYRPTGMFAMFDGHLILHGANTSVSGVEYCLETPYDPNHAELFLLDVEYTDNYSLMLGDPFLGHAITFWPPFDGYEEYNVLCKYSFFVMHGCDQGLDYDFPIVVSPHPDSGYLRGTSWPGHELFDIMGEWSYLCPSHWPPELDSVQVYSPRSVRAWFNQCVYNWELSYNSLFKLYTTFEPHDTIDVLLASKHSPLDAPGEEFFVYLESPMQAGLSYTLEASACCECNGCATSSKRFVYEGGFGNLPDLAVTFWGSHEMALRLPNDCSEVEINYVVRNLGTADCGPFLTRITAAPRDGAEPVTAWSDSCGGLTVNGIHEGTASIIVPYIPAWLGYLRFEADHPGWITEANEEDNHKNALFSNYRPEIISIEDVPGDYGGQVELSFDGSWYDIDRPVEDDIYRIVRLDRASDDWEDVHQLDATSDTIYTCTVPTAVDSSDSSGSYWSVFMVEYYRSSYFAYSSCPDSGYSVNDLGPTAVLLLTSSVETTGESVLVRWSLTECPECDGFSVSRALPGGQFLFIGSLPVPPGEYSFEFEDIFAEPGVKYIYKVEYTDTDGTHVLFETEPAGLPPLPFALHQNRPNPFNPSTEIGFSLPGPSAVTLDIFDVSGKIVRR